MVFVKHTTLKVKERLTGVSMVAATAVLSDIQQ